MAEASKVILRKNADGTTTKILVKKVVKKVKIKPKARTSSVGLSSKSEGATERPKAEASKPPKPPAAKSGSGSGPASRRDRPKHATSARFGKPARGEKPTTPGARKDAKVGTKIRIHKKKKAPGHFAAINYSQDRVRDYSSRREKGEKPDPKTDKLESKERLDQYNRSVSGKVDSELEEFAGVPKSIEIPEVISIKDLALKLNLKASQILKRLFNYGVMDLNVNDNIDAESAQVVCAELNCTVKVLSLLEEAKVEEVRGSDEDYVERSPVVTVMGHVDHGKTTLLDALRDSTLAQQESGGITQHIAAYNVTVDGRRMLIIDTPGHAAFSKMRSRGAKLTDLIVVVVAATEGIKPQTIEAIRYAREATIPLVVAVNKMDLQGADIKSVEVAFSHHEVLSTSMGGEVAFVPISALKKQGLKELLQAVAARTDALGLKANPKVHALGYVLEARIEKGRGSVATILIKNGTLKVGSPYICGIHSGRVRAMFDDNHKSVKSAGPSSVVDVIGFDGFVVGGDQLQVLPTDREAKRIAEARQHLDKKRKASNVKKVTLSNLFDTIKERRIEELKVILKGDVFGTVEAIRETLENLKNDEVRISVLQASTGGINENDVDLAATSNAMVVGFKVKPNSKAQKLADTEQVDMETYTVVYDLIDNLTKRLEGMLKDDQEEEVLGSALVKEVYDMSGTKKVAGCRVVKGKVERDCSVRLRRASGVVFVGKLASLRRFKEDVKSVREGMECGIQLSGFQDFEPGDEIECYQLKTIQRKFEAKTEEASLTAGAHDPTPAQN